MSIVSDDNISVSVVAVVVVAFDALEGAKP